MAPSENCRPVQGSRGRPPEYGSEQRPEHAFAKAPVGETGTPVTAFGA